MQQRLQEWRIFISECPLWMSRHQDQSELLIKKKRQYNFESIIPFPMVLSPSYKKRWINEELNWKKKRVISSTNKKSCTTKYNRSTHKNCRSTTLRLRELSHKKIMQLPCSYHNLVKCNKRSEPLLTYKWKLTHFPGPMLFQER